MSLGKFKLDPSDYEKCNNIWDMKRHPDKAKLCGGENNDKKI